MSTQEQVRTYFHHKANELKTLATLAFGDHPGLTGGHREEIYRIYLREILPKRYEVGRGMVYGPFHRSKEADIVVWDSQNYPSLPLSEHSFFFAESVRAVIECKSTWSSANFGDVLSKCRAVKNIVPMSSGLTLADELASIRTQLVSLATGTANDGMLISRHHIGTAAIFLNGGTSFSLKETDSNILEDADESWPDVMLLLEPGFLVVKNYQLDESESSGRGKGRLESYELGTDVLLGFTSSLLALITERAVQIENPLYLSNYVWEVFSDQPTHIVEFGLTRPVPNRMPIWRRS